DRVKCLNLLEGWNRYHLWLECLKCARAVFPFFVSFYHCLGCGYSCLYCVFSAAECVAVVEEVAGSVSRHEHTVCVWASEHLGSRFGNHVGVVLDCFSSLDEPPYFGMFSQSVHEC